MTAENAQLRPHSRFRTRVTLDQTDAARVMYSSGPMPWAQRGFEELLRSNGRPLELLLTAPVHYPIAKVVIDHFRPLRLGDEVEVFTYIESVGNRSVVIRMIARTTVNDEIALRVDRVAVAVAADGSRPVAEPWLRALAEGLAPGLDPRTVGSKS